MKFLAKLLVLLVITWKCDANLLLGILSTAQEQIHSKVHDVAGTILGTLNKGVNVNWAAQFGVGGQNRPGYGSEESSEEDGRPDSYYNNYGQGSNGYRPNQNSGYQRPPYNQQPQIPNSNGYNRPVNNNQQQYGNGYPDNNQHNNYPHYPPNNNFGQNNHQLRPDAENYGNINNNYNQRYPNNQNQGYHNNQNGGNPNNQNQGYPNNQNQGYPNNQNQAYPNNQNQGYPNNQNQGYPNNQNQGYPNNQYQGNLNNQNQDNQNNQNNPINNGFNNQNSKRPTIDNPVDPGQGTTQTQSYPELISTNTPSTGYDPPDNLFPTQLTEKNEVDKSTQKPTADAPLFIPLGPNEYVYGGDKINVTAPKRETDKKPQKAEEEDFPIDIRFNNE